MRTASPRTLTLSIILILMASLALPTVQARTAAQAQVIQGDTSPAPPATAVLAPEFQTPEPAASRAALWATQHAPTGASSDLEPYWVQRTPSNMPSPRWMPLMAYDSARGVTVLFGGYNNGSLNDTWEWDGVDWLLRTPANKPYELYAPAMAYDSGRGVTVLFGGIYAGYYRSDTWEWDGVDWTYKGGGPPVRANHAMVYDSARGVTVLFGGENGNSPPTLWDTWEWDGTAWEQRSPASHPSARAYHAMAYDSARGVTVLYGGNSGLDDTWEWDGVNWVQRTPANNPYGRTLHAMAYDSPRGVTVLFGGAVSGGQNQTWEWDGANWTQRFPATSPSERQHHDMAYDSARGAVVLFGGYGIPPLGDTWEYVVPLETPVLSPISNPDGDGDYVLDWTAVPEATIYTLEEDDSADFSSPLVVYSGGDTEYQVAGRPTGSTWYYRVRAANPVRQSAWSNVESATVAPAAPTLAPIYNQDGDDDYLVDWSDSSGATAYRIEEDDNSSFTSPLVRYDGADTQYQVSGQSLGTWYYRVVASNAGGESPWSNTESVVVSVIPPEAPVLYAIDNSDGDGTYLIDWSDVASATSYRLEEDDNSSFTSPTTRYTGVSTEYTVTGQPAGTWYYRVRASNVAGDSPWSNTQSTSVVPTAPTLSPISNADGDGSYFLDWNDVTGATGYQLQEDDNSAFTSPTVRYSGPNTQFQVSGQMGGTWYYRVRASNAGGFGPWSNTESTTVIPVVPTLYTIPNPDGNGSYLVDWSNSAGATAYELQEDDNSDFTSPTVRYNGLNSEFAVSGQPAGVWYYRVRASNGAGASPWSNIEWVGVIPAAPALQPISNPDGNGDYLVDWNDVTGATSYELQEDDNSAFTSPSARYTGPDTQYYVVGQPSGTWYYRVRGANAGGPGPWSNTQSVAVDSTPPSSSATSPTYDNAQPIPVDWTASDPEPTSGLYQTCLWYKLGSAGAWTLNPDCQPGTSGTFNFEPPGGANGTYYFQSIAEDNAGNVEPGPSGYGDDSTMFDTLWPQSQADSPERSGLGETIPVTWEASDVLSGLQTTCLWYRLAESGSWTSPGGCQAGPSGTFFFHPFEGSGTYYFQTVAIDNAGNVEPGPADPGDSQTVVRAFIYLPLVARQYRGPLIINGGFEVGSFAGWTHGGTLPQSISAFEPQAGTYTALLGEVTSQQPHSAGSAWAMQELTIPSECTSAPLKFWYRIFANDIEYWSSFHATITDSEGNDQEILRDGYPGQVAPPQGTDLGWRDFTYDLGAYAGQRIRIWFENTNEYNGALGIWTYLDDVVLSCGP